MKYLLSVVIPCYNEQDNVEAIYSEIKKQLAELEKLDCGLEYIFVDDGSEDKTAACILSLSKQDKQVKPVILSRNFGKESAMYAGLEEAKGDFVCVIDADLQDPPSLIPGMLADILSGEYDCVATRRVDRKGEPVIRSFFARQFYKIINKISDVKIVDGARDFRIMTREMTEAVLSVAERNRFSKGIFAWVGFRTKWVSFENTNRRKGETKWSFFKLVMYALDGITASSTRPLTLSAIIGLVFCIISLILIVLIIIRTLVFGDPVAGWPSQVCIMFFIAGIQLFCVGILGIYLSRTYIESKNRPIYIKRKNILSEKEKND